MSRKNVTHLRGLYRDCGIDPYNLPKYNPNAPYEKYKGKQRSSSPGKKRKLVSVGVQTDEMLTAINEIERLTDLMCDQRFIFRLPKLSRKLCIKYFRYWKNKWMCRSAMSLKKFEEENEEEETTKELQVRVKYGDSFCGIKEVSFEEYSEIA